MKVIIDRLTHLTSMSETVKIIWLPAIAFALNFEIHSLSWRGMDYINLKIMPDIRNNIVSQTFVYLFNHSHQFFQVHLAGSISSNSGQNVKEVTQDSLRTAIGMIPQEPSLFHRTLIENIRYGKPGGNG